MERYEGEREIEGGRKLYREMEQRERILNINRKKQKNRGRGGAAVSCRELPEIVENGGRGGAHGICLRLQKSRGNGDRVMSCRYLPENGGN